MKLEDQVCSLEPAKKFKQLGVKQETFFVWAAIEHYQGPDAGPAVEEAILARFDVEQHHAHELCSAFTVAESSPVSRRMFFSIVFGLGFATATYPQRKLTDFAANDKLTEGWFRERVAE